MQEQQTKEERIADFFFELGTMRKLLRSHRQLLLTDDLSDNIASHSFRVTMIGWFLAKEEEVDPYKVVMMCLLHDMEEVRTMDHNYLHKRYVQSFPDVVDKEQLGTLPHKDLGDIITEYRARESREAIVAKDADLIDQIVLLREYAWQGNKEAQIWLTGKGNEKGNTQYNRLMTESARRIGSVLLERNPSDWWNFLWTHKDK
jgi:putative hydrolases of HD superfamily